MCPTQPTEPTSPWGSLSTLLRAKDRAETPKGDQLGAGLEPETKPLPDPQEMPGFYFQGLSPPPVHVLSEGHSENAFSSVPPLAFASLQLTWSLQGTWEVPLMGVDTSAHLPSYLQHSGARGGRRGRAGTGSSWLTPIPGLHGAAEGDTKALRTQRIPAVQKPEPCGISNYRGAVSNQSR